jgi:hypothetical protein
MSGRFEILDGFPADVLAVSAHGRIGRESYEDTLMPAIEKAVAREGKIKLFYLLGEDYDGFTVGAAMDDARLGLFHLHEFARIAVVTDVDWIRGAAHLFGPLIEAPVHAFPLSEIETAKAWIAENSPPESFAKAAVAPLVPTPRS